MLCTLHSQNLWCSNRCNCTLQNQLFIFAVAIKLTHSGNHYRIIIIDITLIPGNCVRNFNFVHPHKLFLKALRSGPYCSFSFIFHVLLNILHCTAYLQHVRRVLMHICDWACENRSCGLSKFDYFSNFCYS